MKPSKIAAVILAALLTSQAGLVAQAGAVQSELANGIRQVEEGDLENAVITLDAVTRALAADNSRQKDLALAHVYLGMAYLGLEQTEKAKEQMKLAWKTDKAMKLDAKLFPPRVIQLYEQVNAAATQTEQAAKVAHNPAAPPLKPSPVPAATPSPVSPSTVEKRSGSKLPIILVGVGGAVAGGVVLASAAGGGTNTDVSRFLGRYSVTLTFASGGIVGCNPQFTVTLDLTANPDGSNFSIDRLSGPSSDQPPATGTIRGDGTFNAAGMFTQEAGGGEFFYAGQVSGTTISGSYTTRVCTWNMQGSRS